ncbi:MAG: hypothetical protein E6J62_00230 [Deltaproteobacteria bacterium]|nr:MAG: hypothetical protein E6J61_10365 [Deltaproteobacteria bacterium]TMB40356.1 MAG: hypothetical protein E6J62_00230 [Deltaproteobacteria bacterium]
MFAGHVGAALIVKRAAPGVGLGKLVAGALLLDTLLGVFVLAGLESVKVPDDFAALHFLRFDFPVSHGFLAAVSWSLIALAIVRKKWGNEAGNAVGLAVFSHWPLDAIEHEPELPLALGSPMVGLSLWHILPLAIALEAVIVAGGLVAYWPVGRGRRPLVAIAAGAIVLLTATQLFATGSPSLRVEAVSWIVTAPLLGLLFGWLDQERR